MERRTLSEKTEHSMAVRIITSLVFALLTVPCAVLGGWFLLILSLLIVGFASYEILSMPGKGKYHPGIWVATYLCIFGSIFWQFLGDRNIREPLFQGNNFSMGNTSFLVSLLIMIVYLSILIIFSLFRNDFSLDDALHLFIPVTLVSLGFYSILFIRYNPVRGYGTIWNGFIPDLRSCLFLWWVLFGVWMSDIGAYFVGVFFGRHPMNAKISPHKTWEGFVGGVILSLVFSFTYVAVVNIALKTSLIPEVLDVLKDPSDWGYVALFALLFPILDNVGGFTFSALKRHYGAKDWGRLLPGHGGVLDRFDGVLVTSIVVCILLVFISSDWSLVL